MAMRNKRKKRSVPVVFPIILIIAALLLASGYLLGKMDRSYPNLYIENIAVGNMSEENIINTLKAEGWQEISSSALKVSTFCGVYEEIDPVAAGTMADIKSAADIACSYGKSGNIFRNLSSFIKCIFTKTDISSVGLTMDDVYISDKINTLQQALNEKLDDDSYYIDEEASELIIIKGYSTGLSLDKALLKEEIVSSLSEHSSDLEFYTLEKEPAEPDFNLLYDKVCSTGHDAAFSTDGSHTIIPEEDMYLFNVNDASALWDKAEAGDEIKIPLEIKHAEVTAEYLESMMYKHLLGAMTTKYNNSGENRCSNVRLATSKVNGTVIFPGEEFSFNETVGARTEEAGFLMAPAYVGYDDIQEELGGGVCQVSTGIYASALYAFLEITAHTCHVYPPNYIQLGTDATVTIPSGGGREIDLKFKNNKAFPLKIVGYCDEYIDEDTGKPIRTVTIEIWGTLEDDDIMPIEFDNTYGDIYDYDRHIEPAYPDREGYRLWFTHDETEFEDDVGKGLRTLTYMRIYNSAGELVDKRILNKMYDFGYGMDTYYYMK